MIAILGAALIVIGVGIVVIKTGQTWSHSKSLVNSPAHKGERPKIPYVAIVLVGIGALLVALSAAVVPAPPPAP